MIRKGLGSLRGPLLLLCSGEIDRNESPVDKLREQFRSELAVGLFLYRFSPLDRGFCS